MKKRDILSTVKLMIQCNYNCAVSNDLLIQDLYAEHGLTPKQCEDALREGFDLVGENRMKRSIAVRWKIEIDLYSKSIAQGKPHYDYRALGYYTWDFAKKLYAETAHSLAIIAVNIESKLEDDEDA